MNRARDSLTEGADFHVEHLVDGFNAGWLAAREYDRAEREKMLDILGEWAGVPLQRTREATRSILKAAGRLP